jgi:hypothetical protein
MIFMDEDYERYACVPLGNSYWEDVCKQCHRVFEVPASKVLPSEEEKEE